MDQNDDRTRTAVSAVVERIRSEPSRMGSRPGAIIASKAGMRNERMRTPRISSAKRIRVQEQAGSK